MVKGFTQISTLDPQQSQLREQLLQVLGPLLGQSGNYLQSLLSNEPGAFEAFEAPYKTQFEQETVPALAERFAGQGALSSSGFQQALGSAGAGLSQQLASLREGMRSQVPGQIMSNLQNLLGQQTQAFLPKASKEMSFLKQLLLGSAGGIGSALGTLPFR